MLLRANAANARQRALNRAETGTRATTSQAMLANGGGPTLCIRPNTNDPKKVMLRRFKAAVTPLKSMIVSSFPNTISLRWAGLESNVSNVPRSFSPAQRSTAG